MEEEVDAPGRQRRRRMHRAANEETGTPGQWRKRWRRRRPCGVGGGRRAWEAEEEADA